MINFQFLLCLVTVCSIIGHLSYSEIFFSQAFRHYDFLLSFQFLDAFLSHLALSSCMCYCSLKLCPQGLQNLCTEWRRISHLILSNYYFMPVVPKFIAQIHILTRHFYSAYLYNTNSTPPCKYINPKLTQ